MTGHKNQWEEEHFRFQAIFESSVDAILAVDTSRHIVLANPSVHRLFGYAPDELVGNSIALLYHRQQDFDEQGKLRYSSGASDSVASYEVEYRRKDGSTFFGEASGRRILSGKGSGKISGYMVTIRDITRQRQLMSELDREKEQWFVTLKSLGDGVIVTDREGLLTYMNSVAEVLTGYSLLEASGRAVEEIFRIESETSGIPVPDPVRRCLAEGRIVGLANHTVLVSRNGTRVSVEDSASPILDAQGQVAGAVLVFRDVTEKRELERRLAHQARFDYLTQIPNRVLFHDRLRQTLEHSRREGTPLALLYMDLDGFKEINDTLGHEAGDRVLMEVANRLKQGIRKEDTVARMGGDEFTVIIAGYDSSDSVLSSVQRIIQELSAPMRIGGMDIILSASVGVAVYPRDGQDPSDLLRNADIAMYKAKERRSNAVEFFSREMTVALDRRISLTNALRHALAHSEIFLEFQPIMDLASKKTVGFETLVRWNHPEKGILYPGDFVDHAESTGLIEGLGTWVLREACHKAAQWSVKEGEEKPFLSVNVSARQLQVGSFFPSTLRSLIEETGFDPKRLELEFPESIFLQKNSVPVMEELRNLGVRIAIDDFGKELSSFGCLRSFPVDRIKLNRELVAEIGQDGKGDAILQALLSLGNSLGISVIGKGVERADQVWFLEKNGCPLIQGYYFSPPVSPERVLSFLLEGFIR